ncbi:MAG: hypothetical protein Q9186_006716 [Xanthomendoza sp. 1 TL-2023]
MPVTEQSGSMTPPCTPLRQRGNAQTHSDASTAITAEEAHHFEMLLPRSCRKMFQRPKSTSSEYEEFGHGAWSTVYRTTEILETPSSALPTPPSSPVGSSKTGSQILAVKAPARKDAHDVLYEEARVLTYLHSCQDASYYIIPFHGYDIASQSLVMDAVPLNLETHAKSCLKKARDNLTTRTMFDPVCGPQEWQSLALQLIDGLAFLHSNHCVHGDIKPSNILLRPNDDGSSEVFTPLYCDFSSSRILEGSTGNNAESIQQLSALTPDFTSPELFTSLHTTNAVATNASDVYALGVTLVVVAIGTSPYAGATMEMMKLSMAREGRVLDFARQADQGTRVMKGKVVERCLKDALAKDVGKRSTVKEWKINVQDIFQGLG